jgi:hypothetical protein
MFFLLDLGNPPHPEGAGRHAIGRRVAEQTRNRLLRLQKRSPPPLLTNSVTR